MNELEEYIRASALKRGLDPDKMIRALQTEGGIKDPFRHGEYTKNGEKEPSYGPFQLLVGKGSQNFSTGLGDKMIEETGRDPRTDWKAGIDYGMDTVAREGWKQWYGPRKAGLPNNYGLTMASSPVGADALRTAVANDTTQTPVDGMAPKLPPPINVDGDSPVPAVKPPTLGDQLGTAIFGDDLSAKLKALSAPATATSPAGPLGNLTGLAGAFTGNKNIEQANQLSMTPPPQLIAESNSEDQARMQGAQQLMASILAARKKPPTAGMTLYNSGGF
jgi:hypothetical protein